jgi:hypothetical protein
MDKKSTSDRKHEQVKGEERKQFDSDGGSLIGWEGNENTLFTKNPFLVSLN